MLTPCRNSIMNGRQLCHASRAVYLLHRPQICTVRMICTKMMTVLCVRRVIDERKMAWKAIRQNEKGKAKGKKGEKNGKTKRGSTIMHEYMTDWRALHRHRKTLECRRRCVPNDGQHSRDSVNACARRIVSLDESLRGPSSWKARV